MLTNGVLRAEQGPINLEVDAVEKCIEFTEGGAAVICVNTEPNVHKGSLSKCIQGSAVPVKSALTLRGKLPSCYVRGNENYPHGVAEEIQ